MESDASADFRNNRMGMRIPAGKQLTLLHFITIFNVEHRAVWQFVTLTFMPVQVYDRQFTGSRYRHQLPVLIGYCFDIGKSYRTIGFSFDRTNCCRTGRRTTNMEGTHGQLSSRLTNGLSSNNTYCFTNIDSMAARQIASVTLRTNTIT